MSRTRFDEADIKRKVPTKVLERTKENMGNYNMSLGDAFEEAARTLAKPGTLLFKAWYHNDFREYIPCVYEEKYLDFAKYPLKYNIKEEKAVAQKDCLNCKNCILKPLDCGNGTTNACTFEDKIQTLSQQELLTRLMNNECEWFEKGSPKNSRGY